MTSKYPILAQAQIVVAGAGPAGCVAAIAAARQGADVILIEESISCGGSGTNGLVPVVIHLGDSKNLTSSGIGFEIIEATCKKMKVKKINHIWQHIDAEKLKRVYDDKLREAGVTVLFSSKVAAVNRQNNRIKSLVVAGLNGLKTVHGDMFIDATGDGLVSALSGVPFEYGDEYGKVMSPTLCVQYSNINLKKFLAAEKKGEYARVIWHRLLKEGRTPIEEHHFTGISQYGNATASGNVGHIYGTDSLNEFSVSQACIEGRKIAELIHEFYVDNVPGCDKSDLVSTASKLGIRESRRIMGDYVLNYEDYVMRRHFDDDIGCFHYPIDIHASNTDPEEQLKALEDLEMSWYKPGESYGIPYRVLTPKGIKNLLVAGRCISADRAIMSSIRVQPGCMITGQAGGIAAVIALDSKCDVRKVNIDELRDKLIEIGAFIPCSKK